MDDADQGLEGGVESLCDLIRGQDACPLVTTTYTNLLTRSSSSELSTVVVAHKGRYVA